MTAEKVLEKLRAALTEPLREALDRLLEEEARTISEFEAGRGLRRRSTQVDRDSLARAQAFYVNEILDYLRKPHALQPEDIIMYRRRAPAWAFAEKLRQFNVSVERLLS